MDLIWVRLGAYFLAGVVVLGAIRLNNFRDYPEMRGPTEKGQRVRVAFSYLALIAIWPLAAYASLADRLNLPQPSGRPRPAAGKSFACKREHLTCRVTVADAEATAKVVDPLHRVPDKPFGHLHTGWLHFTANRQRFDRSWAFEIPGNKDSSAKRAAAPGRKLGYALVRWGKVRAEFLYEWD